MHGHWRSSRELIPHSQHTHHHSCHPSNDTYIPRSQSFGRMHTPGKHRHWTHPHPHCELFFSGPSSFGLFWELAYLDDRAFSQQRSANTYLSFAYRLIRLSKGASYGSQITQTLLTTYHLFYDPSLREHVVQFTSRHPWGRHRAQLHTTPGGDSFTKHDDLFYLAA